MDRSKLTTERRNRASEGIDRLDSLGIVRLINGQDMLIAPAVAKCAKQIAAAVDVIVERFQRGGRLFYVGAGTSGRLGVLDASECPPTYGVKRTMVQGIIAGGPRALVRSIEGAEDDPTAAVAELKKRKLSERDTVVGIAASGVTPVVRGALVYARDLGAATALITCSPEAKGHIPADIVLNPVVGPEVVTGSTRMKAGTATKLVLNTLTTAAMIRIGKVYGNLMVDLRATNAKLRDRAVRIVVAATGATKARAAKLLDQADGHAKTAILMHLRDVDAPTAKKLLKQARGQLRAALQ